MKNAGVFGGTFDPPHAGHLIVAQDAAMALGLDRIIFIPAGSPPHKQDRRISAAPVRARMLELALDGNDQFAMSTLEIERDGPSFTVDTLRALAEQLPGTELTLLVGADQYAEFGTWRTPEVIRSLARVAVMNRAGQETAAPGTFGDVAVEVTRIDISATAIRSRVAEGRPIRYLVPEAVEQLIHEQRLYRAERAFSDGVAP